MSSNYTYSVAIRTLGMAGEKYKKLLDSIQKQTIKPEKIVVVLPEGYSLPEYRLGIEEFVYSPKGMVPQRIRALDFITSDFTLFCDDDVELEESFVEKLFEPLITKEYVCSAGPLLEFFPPTGIKYLFASLIGGASVMIHGRKDTYVRVLRTGGWSYNRSIDIHSHKIYKTESLPWTCFLINTYVMKKIQFDKESWLEMHGYAAFEDRVMFYKLLKNGFKTCVVSDAVYKHNDGKTSTNALRIEPVYAGAFNHYVFWHRCLYSLSKNMFEKLWLKICIEYYIAMSKLHFRLRMAIKKSDNQIYERMAEGFTNAKKFVKSTEYKNLPNVVLEKM